MTPQRTPLRTAMRRVRPRRPGNPRLNACLRGDEGSASIVAAGIITALASVVLVIAGAGSLVAARHQAQVAADLAAVVGAFAAYRGEQACAVAADIAQRNGATVEHCRQEGADVIVTAHVRTRAATAKAGPL